MNSTSANTPNPGHTRSRLHYLASLLLIGFYGIQVCPFIEGLTPLQLATPLVLIVGLQYLLRQSLVPRLIEVAPYKQQVSRGFKLEWGLFVLSGLALTASNSLFYAFPVVSGLKMVLGFSALGFFIAIDLALEREHWLASYFQQQGISLTPDSDYLPLVNKFALFAAMSILFLVGVFFLLINKDLDWLVKVGSAIPLSEARLSVLKEFSFIGIVLIAYLMTVIFSYARNLNHFFRNENQVLMAATAGRLDSKTAVSSNDEFGVMAHHTNIMIDALLYRTQELQRTQDATILSLSSLAEARDNETGAHILRTQRYVRALANALRDHPRFAHELDERTIELL